ncbi:DUF2961 domain-containing protein [Pontiellaceae bacterium B12219]|nr:DUF2961 domain-containing protein [Pontiellaceae bacterium B12219]
MKKRSKIIRLLCAAAALSVLAVQAREPVTIESLLNEMVDYESVARFPEQNFRLKQQSSYNRASKTPDEPQGWFENHDYNSNDKDHNFIRIEENNGRKEWVLMDHAGPGAIVRSWMPFLKPDKPDTDIIIRIYLDGAEEPVLEGNMLGLLDGTGVIPYPFAHQSLRSAVSFFPIPYAKSCKVTTDQRPFFFIFTFREYDEGTPVKTFTMAEFEQAKALTETVGNTLLNPEFGENESPQSKQGTLLPKQEKTLKFPSGEAAAVRELLVKLGNYDDPEITRKVVLKMEFDGLETVWCPIGDFFGCGIGLNPFKGWYREVSQDGEMKCRWVMPYQNAARMTLVNLSDEPVDFLMEATIEPWKWDDRSMYFNAAWRGQYPVPTRPYSDWNYVTLKGRGVYVGDTLTIMNPVEKWWGEGDAKIWVDGEDFPSIFGTGTEDYYAYSWGGRSTDFYEHPFHAQPFSYKYNKLNRKTAKGERNTQGYSTETRTRALDTMPFGRSLQLDMEVWSWTECDMGYGVGVYWYGDAATTSNRKPDPEGALAVPRLPVSEAEEAFAGAVEFEEMTILSAPQQLEQMPQKLKKYKGTWNGDDHVLYKGLEVGDVVEFNIPASSAVAEKLVLQATQSNDFGKLRFSVNGKPAGSDVDFYASKPGSAKPIELGVFEPVENAYILREEVVGKNLKSKGSRFGLDCVMLKEKK